MTCGDSQVTEHLQVVVAELVVATSMENLACSSGANRGVDVANDDASDYDDGDACILLHQGWGAENLGYPGLVYLDGCQHFDICVL